MKKGQQRGQAGLTFLWHHPYRLPWMLMVFMGASVLLHAISFYAFQVVYPTATTLRIPAARLTVVDLSDPAYIQLKNRVEAENPAHIMSTLQRSDEGSHAIAVEHQPSYAATSPRLLAPSFNSINPIPAPGDLFQSLALPKRGVTHPEFAALPLPVVRFISPANMHLEPGGKVELPGDLSPEPTVPVVFLVSIGADGATGSVLLLESSGVERVDRFAEAVLRDANVTNPDEAAGQAGIVHVLVYPDGGSPQSPPSP